MNRGGLGVFRPSSIGMRVPWSERPKYPSAIRERAPLEIVVGLFARPRFSSASAMLPTSIGTALARCRHTGQLAMIGDLDGLTESKTMIVNSDRFGSVEIAESDTLMFPGGIVGFPQESRFVLLRRQDSQFIGWLQSVKTSYLTLPVVSTHMLTPKFPDVDLKDHVASAGLGSNTEELAVLAVLSAAPNEPATVNLLAPIVVNAKTRIGAQIMLEGTHFTTHEAFALARDRGDQSDT